MSDDSFVHLCSKRYIDRVEDVTKVTVYSNLPEVDLFANGVSLVKRKEFEEDIRQQRRNQPIPSSQEAGTPITITIK